jgi:hypothetical protein
VGSWISLGGWPTAATRLGSRINSGITASIPQDESHGALAAASSAAAAMINAPIAAVSELRHVRVRPLAGATRLLEAISRLRRDRECLAYLSLGSAGPVGPFQQE